MRPALPALAAVLVAACADPALTPYRDAAKAYDAGRAALDAGDAATAIQRFSEARRLDPRSRALALWEGRALAQSGRLDEAIAAASDAIALDPKDANAHYNRAAWLARAGRPTAAAAELKVALGLGAGTVWEAARDPDFAPHRGDPAFAAVIPAQDLTATVTPTARGFVGSELVLTITLTGAEDDLPTLTGPATPACLRQRRVVQDDQVAAGTARRTIKAYFTAMSPCTASLGPFEARTGSARVALDSVPVVVLGPDSGPSDPPPDSGPPRPASWLLPAAVNGPTDVPGWPGARATDRTEGTDVLLEWRVDAQTRSRSGVSAGSPR